MEALGDEQEAVVGPEDVAVAARGDEAVAQQGEEAVVEDVWEGWRNPFSRLVLASLPLKKVSRRQVSRCCSMILTSSPTTSRYPFESASRPQSLAEASLRAANHSSLVAHRAPPPRYARRCRSVRTTRANTLCEDGQGTSHWYITDTQWRALSECPEPQAGHSTMLLRA